MIDDGSGESIEEEVPGLELRVVGSAGLRPVYRGGVEICGFQHQRQTQHRQLHLHNSQHPPLSHVYLRG